MISGLERGVYHYFKNEKNAARTNFCHTPGGTVVMLQMRSLMKTKFILALALGCFAVAAPQSYADPRGQGGPGGHGGPGGAGGPGGGGQHGNRGPNTNR
ncbi:hypothetical protein AD928_00530 [Acetobacter cerevisiae]|uniref:Uncharacterized protein n=2 Tax=Acetobacter cerevisiae TaxID=178900 RepID=A0A149R009_9PROT|nr:hypothetical protein AD928_00530 [Acetobacter cerevisiae]